MVFGAVATPSKKKKKEKALNGGENKCWVTFSLFFFLSLSSFRFHPFESTDARKREERGRKEGRRIAITSLGGRKDRRRIVRYQKKKEENKSANLFENLRRTFEKGVKER